MYKTLLLALLSLPLAAQTTELFTGYSWLSLRPTATADRNNLNGWHTTLSYFPTRRLGLAADFGGNYGTLDQHSFLFGPQLRLLRRARIETSFRALFGTVRANGNNAFGSAIGGAIDISINKRIKWRIQPGIFLTRYNGDLERNFRLSTGPVFTFGGRP